MLKRVLVCAAFAALVLGVTACSKMDEMPANVRGSYKVPRFVLGNVTLVIEAKGLKTPDCKVNCGEEKQDFKSITREGGLGGKKFKYTTNCCSGEIELEDDGSVSVKAKPVPGAPGDEGHRNMSCAQISGNHLKKL